MYLHLKIRNKNLYKETIDYTPILLCVHSTDNVIGNTLKCNCQPGEDEKE